MTYRTCICTLLFLSVLSAPLVAQNVETSSRTVIDDGETTEITTEVTRNDDGEVVKKRTVREVDTDQDDDIEKRKTRTREKTDNQEDWDRDRTTVETDTDNDGSMDRKEINEKWKSDSNEQTMDHEVKSTFHDRDGDGKYDAGTAKMDTNADESDSFSPDKEMDLVRRKSGVWRLILDQDVHFVFGWKMWERIKEDSWISDSPEHQYSMNPAPVHNQMGVSTRRGGYGPCVEGDSCNCGCGGTPQARCHTACDTRAGTTSFEFEELAEESGGQVDVRSAQLSQLHTTQVQQNKQVIQNTPLCGN